MSGTYVKLPVTTTDPVGPAGGDLAGSYPNPTVATVGGSTAANIHTAQLAVAAATNANTASTIVKRNASGSFTAGDCTFGQLTATGMSLSGGSGDIEAGRFFTAVGLVVDSHSFYYPGSFNKFADDNGFLYYTTNAILATGNSVNYPSGNQLADINGNIYYGDGASLLADNLGNLSYSYNGGTSLADAAGNLFYSNSNTLADAGGNLYYGGGTGAILADGNKVLYARDNLQVTTVGKGLQITEGANARMGTAVLNGITAVVVSNTTITATTRIFLTINTAAGTPGSPYVSARVASTSFSIKSTGAADTSTVAYLLIEPL